ncbi:hypothetical protein BDV18DRAFT_18305 [Aspergillus unguis]
MKLMSARILVGTASEVALVYTEGSGVQKQNLDCWVGIHHIIYVQDPRRSLDLETKRHSRPAQCYQGGCGVAVSTRSRAHKTDSHWGPDVAISLLQPCANHPSTLCCS